MAAAETETGTEESPLGHLSMANRITVQLPPGELTLTGYVQDRLGASSSAVAPASVAIQQGVDANELAQRAGGRLDGLLEQADGEAVVRAVGMLSQVRGTSRYC